MATTIYTIGPAIFPPTGGGPVLIESVFQQRVPSNGGYRLDLHGTFPVGQRLRVYVGVTGSSADAKCLSGKAGQGSIIYAVDDSNLHCYTPLLPVGGPFAVTVQSLDTGNASCLPQAVATIKPDFKTSVFALKSMLPTVLLVGPRKVEDVPPIPNP